MTGVRHPTTRLARAALLLPLTLLVLALCANAGIQLAQDASAASDSVVATATVGSSLQVADGCSGAFAISVVQASYAADDCAIDFGASNDATTTLRISSSAGSFLSGAFTDHLGGCGALVNDTVGIKYTGGDAGVSSSLGCATSAMGTNADFVAVPDAFMNACAATTMGTANTCTLAIGIKETGSDATAGSYTGTLDLDVIG